MSTPHQLAPEYRMMLIAGISIAIGAVCVLFIKEGKAPEENVQENPVESEMI